MRRIVWVALALSILLPTGINAADSVGQKLTSKLKDLLIEEMQQVSRATGDLAQAIATGDHQNAMKLATGIRDSFILKKSLTAQDKKDLMGAVPPEFIALDRHFHALAGKLAHAAEMKDSQIQGFFFSEMVEACVACHSKFARDRFPGLDTAHAGEHKH